MLTFLALLSEFFKLILCQQQQQQPNTQFVRICGQYPNRYLAYGPCPGENGQQQQQFCSRIGWQPLGITCRLDSDCLGQQQMTRLGLNLASAQCDRGQCCAPVTNPNNPNDGGQQDGGTYLWWDTCENGGYFTGQSCQSTRDCLANNPGGRWAQYGQICLQGECCTTTGGGGGQLPDDGGNVNLDDRCLRNGGRRIRNSGCIRHADCNILVGRLPGLPRIAPVEQLLCQQSQCCLMPRTLPIGFTSWAQACPQSGGRFLGMFCQMDQQDCRTTADSLSRTPQRAVCELRRYCCASAEPTNDRSRRQNLGCDQGDRPTGSRCQSNQQCFQGEYCGDQNICCLLRGNDARPDPYIPPDQLPDTGRDVPAFCYNGQQSMVPCNVPDDCKQMTQACVNGLCCTRTGDEWKNACGGAMAVSSCFQDRSCHDRLVCTSSDYCCECAYGQAAGKCTHGCPPNYGCDLGGEYCCPRCTSGEQPHGSCYNGQCGTGYVCSAGNICCRS